MTIYCYFIIFENICFLLLHYTVIYYLRFCKCSMFTAWAYSERFELVKCFLHFWIWSGSKCPIATDAPTACPEGTYQDDYGMDSCIDVSDCQVVLYIQKYLWGFSCGYIIELKKIMKIHLFLWNISMDINNWCDSLNL